MAGLLNYRAPEDVELMGKVLPQDSEGLGTHAVQGEQSPDFFNAWPSTFECHYPSRMLDQMAATVETVEIDGIALTSHRLVTTGPICIRANHRHNGVYAHPMDFMRQYAGDAHGMAPPLTLPP